MFKFKLNFLFFLSFSKFVCKLWGCIANGSFRQKVLDFRNLTEVLDSMEGMWELVFFVVISNIAIWWAGSERKDVSFIIQHRNIQILAVVICTFHHKFLPSMVNNATKFHIGPDSWGNEDLCKTFNGKPHQIKKCILSVFN